MQVVVLGLISLIEGTNNELFLVLCTMALKDAANKLARG